ncbi:MAG: hypothetical protein EBV06_10075 [Planctomycetia bacterium]|nr:hypothetical protein [Planctomycetia bacterium]
MNTIAVENTLPEKLLLAASHLEESGQSTFSAEALIVSAWQKYPRTFGLKGFEEKYPDSNRVLALIMGQKGLPNRGWMVKVGQKLYSLTHDGRQVVRKILQGEEVPPLTARRATNEPKLPKDLDILLQMLLCSTAYHKLRQGRQDEWTFSEACRFWSMGERAGVAVDERLHDLLSQLTVAERCLASGPQKLGNSVEATAEMIGQLAHLHQQLEKRFARHLNLLRSRADRAE